MMVAKQYSPETILAAKEFVTKKGKHLAYLIEKRDGAKRGGYKQEERRLDEEVTSLRRRINKAKLITLGYG